MKSLLALLVALFDDLKRLHPDVVGFDRDLQTIKARLEDEGDSFLSVALPSFGKAFDLALSTGRMTHVLGFARNKSLPKFLSGLTSLVFDTKTGHLLEEPANDAILSVRQLCYLFKKYLPSDSRNEHLERVAIKDFKVTDNSISGVADFRLEFIGRLCKRILPTLDEYSDLSCKHGPGAVFEGYSANQKWSATYRGLLEFDHRLLSVGFDLPAMLAAHDLANGPQIVDDLPAGSARLVTVPKSCSALRTITVEPCLNQFVQQGFNSFLREEISRSPVLSVSLTLDSQVPNQELALEGSRTGEWCTVDLSSASDLLSLLTVKSVFALSPRFLTGLLSCRTPSVILDDGPVTLKKYAGMGNATTFPVQSVCFALIAMASMLHPRKKLDKKLLVAASRNVHVFGDDIIIRTECFPAFADWINSFGLKINQGKTFTIGNFRESCGVDAFRGTDVTPVYLRHDPGFSGKDPNALTSIVSTSNQLWLRGYYRSSDYLKWVVESRLGKLPLVSNSCSGLGWHSRHNVRSGSKWNRSLHRYEVRTFVPSSKRRRDELDGEAALLKYYHLPDLGKDDPTHLESSSRKHTLVLRRRWVQS